MIFDTYLSIDFWSLFQFPTPSKYSCDSDFFLLFRTTEKESFGEAFFNCNFGFDESDARMLGMAEIPQIFKTDFLICDKVKGQFC